MWVFYHDIASTSSSVPSISWAFAGFTLLTGLIVLSPTYFERRQK